MPAELGARVEVRRLMSWFNEKFFDEVSGALVMERVYKRYIPAGSGGGSPGHRNAACCEEQHQVPSGLYRLARPHAATGSPATT